MITLGKYLYFIYQLIVGVFDKSFSVIRGLVIAVEYFMGSFLILLLTLFFVGAVFAYGAYDILSPLGLQSMTVKYTIRGGVEETVPVIAFLVLAGRIGSATVAKLGTMKMSDQIDFLKVAGLDPFPVLISPNFFAVGLATPFLAVFSVICFILGVAVVLILGEGMSPAYFMGHLSESFSMQMFQMFFLKCYTFSSVIITLATFLASEYIYDTESLTSKVTLTISLSTTLILILNCLITIML